MIYYDLLRAIYAIRQDDVVLPRENGKKVGAVRRYQVKATHVFLGHEDYNELRDDMAHQNVWRTVMGDDVLKVDNVPIYRVHAERFCHVSFSC